MKEFFGYILGELTIAWYAAAFVFNFLGLFIRWSVTTTIGIRKNVDVPKFNLAYWWYNNGRREVLRVLEVLAIVFVSLRFCSEWFQTAPSMAVACGFGLAYDLLRYFFRRKTQGQGSVIPGDEQPK